jgi:hypothetical protein
MRTRPGLLALAAVLASAGGVAQAGGLQLGWSASAGVDGGYDDNVSISPFAKPGERQPSATAGLSAELGGHLDAGRFSTELSYGLDQTFYFSYRDLDLQSHEISAELGLSLGPVEISPSYGVELNIRLPTAMVFHSVDHKGKLELDVSLHPAVHALADYELTYFDVRDEVYAYLGGTQHVARLYPRFFLFDALLLSAGYRLEVARLGTVQDTISSGGMGEMTVDLPLSYVGHFGFVTGYWEPHPRVSLLLLLKAGRKSYDELTSGGSGGKWGGTSRRSDTLARVNALASWVMVAGLSLEANLVFEASDSSVSTRHVTGSYTNLIATLGVSYDFSSDE